MNVFDVLILAAVGVMLFLAIRRVRKNGKSGTCACWTTQRKTKIFSCRSLRFPAIRVRKDTRAARPPRSAAARTTGSCAATAANPPTARQAAYSVPTGTGPWAVSSRRGRGVPCRTIAAAADTIRASRFCPRRDALTGTTPDGARAQRLDSADSARHAGETTTGYTILRTIRAKGRSPAFSTNPISGGTER